MHPPPPPVKEKTIVEEKSLEQLVIKTLRKDSPVNSNDLEWDSNDDFIDEDVVEKENLLKSQTLRSDEEQDR